MGVALGWLAVRVLVTSAPATLPRLEEIRLTGISLAFTLGLSIVTAMAFAAAPLMQRVPLLATCTKAAAAPRPAGASASGTTALMAVQTALALVCSWPQGC